MSYDSKAIVEEITGELKNMEMGRDEVIRHHLIISFSELIHRQIKSIGRCGLFSCFNLISWAIVGTVISRLMIVSRPCLVCEVIANYIAKSGE